MTQRPDSDRERISPCLWFDNQAEEAANFYVSLFDDARIVAVTRYPEAGTEIHGKDAGSVLTVTFELAHRRFVALNGGPHFTFSNAVSFMVECEDQDEVDRLWHALSEDGVVEQCGWLKDRYGLSWQVVPRILPELLSDPDTGKASRVMNAMLQMAKIDIAALRRAHAGEGLKTAEH